MNTDDFANNYKEISYKALTQNDRLIITSIIVLKVENTFLKNNHHIN